jgi:hypothetical protein
MAEITEAVQQDQIAESLMSEPEQQTQSAEESGAETQELETQEQEGTELETQEETAEDWLPDEQSKVYPDDVLQRYAEQRYPEIWKLIEAGQASDQMRQLLYDKLNTDIYLRQLSQQEQFQEPEEEAEQPVVQRQEPTQPQQTTQQWLQGVQRIAESITDNEVANAFSTQFLQAFGVKEAPTPEMARALTTTMTTFGLNLLNTVLPQMLNSPVAENKSFFQQLMEQNYEAFGESYESSMYERAWNRATSASPDFAKLPGLNVIGSSQARMEAAARIAGSVEDFDNIQFRDKSGKPLSPYQNAVKKYSLLAKEMAGQKLTPAEAKNFLEAGKRSALASRTRKEAGNLGSGKSNGQIATNPDDADFWKEGVELYKREHGGV